VTDDAGACPSGPCELEATALSVGIEEDVGRSGPPTPECLSDDEILLYGQGATSEAQKLRIHAHLDVCGTCREIVHFVIADDEPASERSLEVTTFAPGDVVKDRYTIERFVGKGGMGEVYRSFDRLLGKPVALKTVLCASGDDPRAVRKLFDEVRNAQRVAHPHVCRIYELQEHEDASRFSRPVPFFTMEFVDGERLAIWMRNGALPSADVRTIALQLLAGLHAAHDKGVLHLDFKSDNVLLRRDGPRIEALIMDFGLSRSADGEHSVRTSERLRGAGTLPYMSLEQLECRADVGPAADVYAFGVVLYEMLTGRLPFEGATPAAMLLKQLKERPVPASTLKPGLSRILDAFLARCLSADPSARYLDAGAALAALERVGPWEHPVPVRPRSRRAALAAIMVGIVCVAGLGLLGGTTRRREQAKPAASIVDPRPDTTVQALRPEPLPEAPALAVAPARPEHRATSGPRPKSAVAALRQGSSSAPSQPRSSGANWIPRAVPKGGFWQPPLPPKRDSPEAAARSSGQSARAGHPVERVNRASGALEWRAELEPRRPLVHGE
jgi:serine/threonine protein kinase